MFREKLIIAGFGGQGVLRAGQIIAHAGLNEGKEVSWLPSYGAEMRGGTANCSVIISETEIPFPVIENPDFCIVMNTASLEKFEGLVKTNGVLFLNESIISQRVERTDIKAYYIPADSIAEEENNPYGANMVLMGAYIAVSGSVSVDSICKVIEESFTGTKAGFVKPNQKLVIRGYDFMNDYITK